MYNINFRKQSYQCRSDETLLQAFQRQGVDIPFSCQKGSCHVCMLQCVEGTLPVKSQSGLRTGYVEKGYFLPCQCHPKEDMVIAEIQRDQLYHTACIHKKEFLSDNVCRLLIDCDKMQGYRPGQFINLSRPSDGLARSYSLASYPDQDYYLELHVKRMKNGVMSNWIFDELQEQDMIDVQGATGDCYYRVENRHLPMLLIAGGTGLAPMMGILKEAFAENHNAAVHLYHEANCVSDLYMSDVLRQYEAEHENFSYFPCVTVESRLPDMPSHTAVNRVSDSYHDLSGWSIYTAGSPGMVSALCSTLEGLGVSREKLFTDPFELRDLRSEARVQDRNHSVQAANDVENNVLEHVEVGYPEADIELWEALDQGRKLYYILEDFYSIVYADERLAPFFKNVTRQRSIEKAYLFLKQLFSGEKVYFGDRPRNAHHWMVISDELFDYREDIMESCLRKHGLPEHLIRRWRAIEESFRPDIVKDKPWNKVMNGVELQLEGYEEIDIDSGSLCDSCQQPIEAGTRVRYHLRLGSIYCPDCMQTDNNAPET